MPTLRPIYNIENTDCAHQTKQPNMRKLLPHADTACPPENNLTIVPTGPGQSTPTKQHRTVASHAAMSMRLSPATPHCQRSRAT